MQKYQKPNLSWSRDVEHSRVCIYPALYEGLCREKADFTEKMQKSEDKLEEIRENERKLKSENAKWRQKQQSEKEKSSNLERKLRQNEETIKYLEFDLSLSRKKIEKLEEDLTVEKDQSLSLSAYHERHVSSRTFIHDEAGSASSSDEAEVFARPSHPRRDLSLTLREDIMQDEELFSGIGCPVALLSHSGVSNHFTFDHMDAAIGIAIRVAEADIQPAARSITRNFTFGLAQPHRIETVEIASIPPPKKPGNLKPRYSRTPQRKDPGEEFFILVICTQAVQAIKLNSPYMDIICREPPQALYQLAIDSKVPFHLWYSWIEDRLKEAYLSLTAKGSSMEILGAGKAKKSY